MYTFIESDVCLCVYRQISLGVVVFGAPTGSHFFTVMVFSSEKKGAASVKGRARRKEEPSAIAATSQSVLLCIHH